ncbi:aromatic ring-opening dioxygenase LigA [Cellulomonas fimi]|uniref:Aromatic ring-opening dioxygenase LigA n=1 Tax=Cellulomonas fimi TaxID=1708 RepID=A0A7Y0LW80_CELFI|nr:aromatic ring-opening dioxygenase LigA [Cellulomonas fimi]NMR18964.1 aromatic ring-opening dioxygenase LigA [Cellulomonas fimi]
MSTNKTVKFIGLFSIVAGIVMILAGGATWAMVTSQLKAENITVAPITEENPGALVGDPVAGPFTAFAQANAINEHTITLGGGKTYAEIGDEMTALREQLAADGDSPAEIAENEELAGLQTQRNSVMNGSFLRASLFTSVVSYGVAALVIGLGLLFSLLGYALTRLASGVVTTSAPALAAAQPVGARA